MRGVLVEQIFNLDRSLRRELAVLTELIACCLEKLSGLFYGLIIIVVDGIGIEVSFLRILLEDAAVAVHHAQRDVGVCDHLTGLADVLDDVVTVNQEVDSLTHVSCLLRCLILEEIGIHVEGDVVGTKLIHNVEFRILGLQKSCHFVGRNGIDEVNAVGIVSCVDCGIISGKHELKLVDLDVVCIPEVGVLLIGHGCVMLPVGADICAVADKSCLLAPSARGGLPVSVSLNSILLDRIEGRECHQVFHVCAGSCENELKGGCIHSGYVDALFGTVAVETGEHVLIVCSGLRVNGSLPAVYEVFCGQVGTIGPLQAFLQLYGVGQAILGYFIAVSAGRNRLALGVIGVQTGEGVCRKAGTVYGAVQRGIQIIRLGSQVDAQGICTIFHLCIHEELGGKCIRIHTLDIILLHVQVVVVIERNHRIVGHQDVLCLVHQLGTLCHIGL